MPPKTGLVAIITTGVIGLIGFGLYFYKKSQSVTSSRRVTGRRDKKEDHKQSTVEEIKESKTENIKKLNKHCLTPST